jgi:hypothetical protein
MRKRRRRKRRLVFPSHISRVKQLPLGLEERRVEGRRVVLPGKSSTLLVTFPTHRGRELGDKDSNLD